MVHGARENVRDGFLAAVGVVWEAGSGGDGGVVEQEEGGYVAEGGGPDAAADGGACAFGLGAGFEDLADGAGGGRGGVEGGVVGGDYGEADECGWGSHCVCCGAGVAEVLG